MATVTRDIRIDAAPEVVRRNLVDPERRRTWLGEEVDAEPTGDGLRYERPEGDRASRVHIEVVPEGDGSRVTVTEEVESAPNHDDTPVASVTHLPSVLAPADADVVEPSEEAATADGRAAAPDGSAW